MQYRGIRFDPQRAPGARRWTCTVALPGRNGAVAPRHFTDETRYDLRLRVLDAIDAALAKVGDASGQHFKPDNGGRKKA